MERVERELIFALQAVQMGLISKDVLVDVGLRWIRERTVDRSASPLRERVMEAGILSFEDVALLDQVVARMLKEDGEDPSRTLQRLGGGERVFESFGGTSEAVRESIAALLGEPLSEAASESDATRCVTPEHWGRYVIQGEHGRGGIGRVLVAHDAHVGREIAIKELLPEANGGGRECPSGRFSARFLREARVTGQLEHPNIVPVYEVGRRQDGTLYYTMRLVRGKTLAQTLRACTSLEERLRLLPHYVDLCHAIAYAHSRGVIHRDIKTGNVMLGEFGETVVLDWGLAKVRGQQDIGVGELEREVRLYRDEEAGRTVDGRAIGTPAYMSPEQADGRIEDIDERSDVWSLGAVLYELLTGRPPFEGVNAFEVIGKVLVEPVPSVRHLEPQAPPDLSSVCAKALQRDPGKRYLGARQLAEEVEAYQSGARVTAYEYSSWELLKRFVQRNRAVSAAAVIFVIVLLSAAGIIYSAYRSAEEARRRAEGILADKRKAQNQARVASHQLAQAYLATAEREVALRDFMSAKIYAAAALLYHPDNPRSPYFFGGARAEGRSPAARGEVPAQGASSWEKTLLGLQSLFHTVRAHNRVHRVGSLTAPQGGAIFALAWSPQGDRLAAAGAQGEIRIWEVDRGPSSVVLPSQGFLLASLAWSPDGRLLASAGEDHGVRIWDPARASPLAVLEGTADAVLGLSFSPDGRWLAASNKDGTVRVWEVATRSVHAVLRGHEEAVFSVAFAREGGWIASSGADRSVRLWRLPLVPTDEPVMAAHTLHGHEGSVFAVTFAPDGLLLASAGEDRTLRLWDVAEAKSLAVLRGHDQLVRAISWDPGGKILATASFDQTVRLWGISERQVLATLRGHIGRVDAVAFSGDGALLASAGRGGIIRLWGVRHRAPVLTLSGHRDLVEAVAVSPDGHLLASAGHDQTVRLWDLEVGQEIRVLTGHSKAVLAVGFSPSGSLLASAGRDHEVRLWDVADGRLQAVLSGHVGEVGSLAFSPDGRWLVTGGADRTVRLWHLESRTLRRVHALHGDDVYSVAFAPDSQRFASSSFDGNIHLWSVNREKPTQTLSGSSGYAFRIAFSPDGLWLAAARQRTERQSDIELWNLAKGREPRRLVGHRAIASSLAFSPDGSLLLSGGQDRTVRLWDLSTMQLVQVLEHARDVSAVAFTPDGKRFVASDWKTIRVYPLEPPVGRQDPADLLEQAQKQAGLRLHEFSLRPSREERGSL